MAEINTRKRGEKWEYRFEAARVGGKRKHITKGGFGTKKEALAAGTKALAEYNQSGLHFVPSDLSLSDYFDYWMEQYCKINLKNTTYEGYEKKIRLYLKPELGKYKLSSLTPAILQTFINNKFNDGFSRNTLAVIKGILSGSLSYAVEPLRFLQSSPMSYVKLPSTRAVSQKPSRKKDKEVVSPEEWNKIIVRFPEGHPCHIPLQLAYRCGCRLGEAFALTWSDIDLDAGELDINKQVQMIDGFWTFTNPKYDSFRKIKIDSKLIQILKLEKERQQKSATFYAEHYQKIYETSKRQITTSETQKELWLVNSRENGTYVQPRVMQHCSRVIHYELKYSNWDYHSLRHTHTTMLLESGANPVSVQKRLGHKNIETTLGIYAHCTKKMQDTELEIIESILN